MIKPKIDKNQHNGKFRRVSHFNLFILAFHLLYHLHLVGRMQDLFFINKNGIVKL